jgi:integrase/recombinase XerD
MRPVPTLEQIWHVLGTMPSQTAIQKRDRALIAFTLLTGARDGAIASMKLKHVDLVEGSVFQDAREVKTKFSKTFPTYFFPAGDEALAHLADWVAYLRGECLHGNDDPLFPKTQMALDGNGQWEVRGLSPEHWSNATRHSQNLSRGVRFSRPALFPSPQLPQHAGKA